MMKANRGEWKKKDEPVYDIAGSRTYTYEELKGIFPKGVKPDAKEQYLEDSVFEELFKMTKAEFGELKKWRQ